MHFFEMKALQWYIKFGKTYSRMHGTRPHLLPELLDVCERVLQLAFGTLRVTIGWLARKQLGYICVRFASWWLKPLDQVIVGCACLAL
jgi:hypothetical protein